MQYLAFFGLTGIIAGLGVFYLLYPMTKRAASLEVNPQSFEQELLLTSQQRDSSYITLQELDQDFASGHLTASDYHELRASYKRQAVVALITLDKLEARQKQISLEIELAIVHQKIRLKSKTRAKAAGPTLATSYCSRCGSSVEAEASYCPKCGQKLAKLVIKQGS